MAALLAIALLTPGTISYLQRHWPEREVRREFNQRRLRAAAVDGQAGRKFAVIIGSSLARHAFEGGGAFEAGSEDASRRPAIHLLLSRGPALDMDPTLFPALVAARPAIVLIQDHAPFYNAWDPGFDRARWRKHVGGWFRRLLRPSSGAPLLTKPMTMEEMERAPDFVERFEVSEKTIDSYRDRYRRLFAGKMRPDFALLIAECHAVGIPVVFLPLPVHPRWLRATADQRAAIESEISRLVAAGLAQRWECPPVDEARFLDLRHLDAAGREQYSDWLAGRLAGLAER